MNGVTWRMRITGIILFACLVGLPGIDSVADDPGDSSLTQGKQLVMARNKGNCLACHAIDDGELPGNLGPPLLSMQLRFPDKEVLRRQIWDATERNPDSRMPPFGKNEILDDEEIDAIVDYLYSL